jgi:signal transduction histidine kinase
MDPILALLPSVFDSVADGVTVLDRSGTIRFANAAAARLMGFATSAELVGRPAAEVVSSFELLDTDGNPLSPDALPTRAALAGADAPDGVVRFRAAGGVEDRWSFVRARLLRGESEADDLVVSSFQDITVLKRAEQRMSFVARASATLGDSIDYPATLARVAELCVPYLADWCVVDVLEADSNVRRVAVAHQDPDLVDLAREIQRRWPMDPDRKTGVAEVLRSGTTITMPRIDDAFLAERARSQEHAAMLRRLGIGSAVLVPITARSQVLGVLTLICSEARGPLAQEDVAAAEELGRRAGSAIDAARLVADAEDAVRLRDEFMAVTSHDMRTPLAAMRGYAQLALRHIHGDKPVDPTALERWLTDIDEGVMRLNRYVSEFLDASLIRGGQEVPLQLSPTDIVAIVRESVTEHRRTAERHDIELTSKAEQLTGRWDASRLARVVDNLLGNAVKFSPDGGSIGVHVARDGADAVVAVTDRGIGIPPADLRRIFAPAFRARNARRVVGTGLGLAGSHRLVTQMGGSIEVVSELGSGSTFTLRMPLGDAEG